MCIYIIYIYIYTHTHTHIYRLKEREQLISNIENTDFINPCHNSVIIL